MLSKRETELILEEYFNDCLKFWRAALKEECARKAFRHAISDVECVTHNPFSPQGELLDEEAKKEFIKYREMDL